MPIDCALLVTADEIEKCLKSFSGVCKRAGVSVSESSSQSPADMTSGMGLLIGTHVGLNPKKFGILLHTFYRSLLTGKV